MMSNDFSSGEIDSIPLNFDIGFLAPESFGLGYGTLLDHLRIFKFIYVPDEHITKQFQWYASLTGDISADSLPKEDMLFLVHLDAAQAVLDAIPNCFCLALSREDSLPSWINEKPYRRKVIVIKKDRHFYEYGSFLQNVFMGNLLWENRLDRIVYNRGKLDTLIATSEGVLDDFICITDSGFNLITYSKGCEPPSETYKYLIESNCYDEDEITFLEGSILPQSRRTSQLIFCEADDSHPYPTLQYPLYIDGKYLFHVVMVCASSKSIDRQKELFTKFMKRLSIICQDFWKTTVNIETPWHRVLLGLVNGEAMSQHYQETQLSMTDIPSAYQFRLLHFVFDDCLPYQERSLFVERANMINKGLCYPFMHGDVLLVLCYAISSNDAMLSVNNVCKSLEELGYENSNVVATSSQAFHEIKDLGFAYRQATIAYSLRGSIKREYEFLGLQENLIIYPFEHALQFYILDPEHDESLVDFSFQNSITQKVVTEDLKAGTQLARLFWTYAMCERNATETSKRIYVHRNTVLYHVSRLEKRFDVSLDSPLSRNRMLLDYLYLFSNMDDSMQL